ncbi:MAG: sigma-70 family RNA polymerase sigma factor [Verrucomicrobia bacterium]|nr:sigma-70 family RNA polymerase sigma factor [Verrucomicrobiota bacterium]
MTFLAAETPSAATAIQPDPVASACPDETALIRDAAAGDSHAFGQIVRLHHARVFNYLRQMTRHHQDAEDLTQQTFIKAHRHLASFDRARPILNWLLTIARNSALNHFRDTKKWDELPADSAATGPSPARVVERREQEENLWARARALLGPREYEVLWLRFAEEMSVRETAAVVGLTESHVKVIIFRARQALLARKE